MGYDNLKCSTWHIIDIACIFKGVSFIICFTFKFLCVLVKISYIVTLMYIFVLTYQLTFIYCQLLLVTVTGKQVVHVAINNRIYHIYNHLLFYTSHRFVWNKDRSLQYCLGTTIYHLWIQVMHVSTSYLSW